MQFLGINHACILTGKKDKDEKLKLLIYPGM